MGEPQRLNGIIKEIMIALHRTREVEVRIWKVGVSVGDDTEFQTSDSRLKMSGKQRLANWLLPWLAMFIVRLPYHKKLSLFLDRLLVLSEGS
jgi:hypothetical protein